MSLNKLTNLDPKNWMNINCNEIKCATLAVAGGSISSSDSKLFIPDIIITDTTIISKNAYYTYSNNVMTITLNASVTATSSATINTIKIVCPTGYTILNAIEVYPASGLLTNRLSTPYTAQETYTIPSLNSVYCSYRSNGTSLVSGQVCHLTYIGTFTVTKN